jgi:hypothetical protein
MRAALPPARVTGLMPPREATEIRPEQGGWHTGVRFAGRWLAHISTEIVLRLTHSLPAPADPPGFDQ